MILSVEVLQDKRHLLNTYMIYVRFQPIVDRTFNYRLWRMTRASLPLHRGTTQYNIYLFLGVLPPCGLPKYTPESCVHSAHTTVVLVSIIRHRRSSLPDLDRRKKLQHEPSQSLATAKTHSIPIDSKRFWLRIAEVHRLRTPRSSRASMVQISLFQWLSREFNFGKLRTVLVG